VTEPARVGAVMIDCHDPEGNEFCVTIPYEADQQVLRK